MIIFILRIFFLAVTQLYVHNVSIVIMYRLKGNTLRTINFLINNFNETFIYLYLLYYVTIS